MTNKLILLSACLSSFLVACDHQDEKIVTTTTQQNTSLFPKGERVTNNNFTGNTWLKSLVEADSLNPISVGNVTFEPGSRTKWHSHPSGQIILATDGTGYYQEKGKKIKILRKGDVIKCQPNIIHWHGASPDEQFAQVTITSRKPAPPVWLQPVTNAEYLGAKE